MMKKPMKMFADALFAVLLVFAAGLGALVGMKHQDEPVHIAAAHDTARELARNWAYADIKGRFLPDIATGVDEASAQNAFDSLRALGHLHHIENAAVSGYKASYSSQDGLSRLSTITFIAHFERGAASFTATLVTRNGVTMLQHLHVKPRAAPHTTPGRTLA